MTEQHPVEEHHSATLIHFPSTATIDYVDAIARSTLEGHRDDKSAVTLDLRNCSFIDIPSVLYLLSLLRWGAQQERDVDFRLPTKKSVRDFLRAWQFPDAVKRTTGIPFWHLVHTEDRHYFGENESVRDETYKGIVHLLDTEWEREISTKYLYIMSFLRSTADFSSSLALSEADRWKRRLISTVLSKQLKGPYGFFTSRIIYETIMNAVRHPAASMIHSASHLDRPKAPSKGKKCHLTVSCWDDGRGIVETLQRVLERDLDVRAVSQFESPSTFMVRSLNEESGEERVFEIPAGFTPDSKTGSDLLLVSSILPGITRDVRGIDHKAHPDLIEDNPILAGPGMGLYLLVNAAVRVYGGTVAIRSGNLFMNVRDGDSPYESDSYRVKIVRYRENHEFLGNMITVRLPLVE